MTYTFKLSRRLAVSRYATLVAFALLIGCDAETTAPDSQLNSPNGVTPWIRVVPSTVTIETNQTVRFRGERRSPRGEVRETSLWWKASGGSIDTLGNFVATSPGVYKVIGRGRGRQKPDTSVVVVVPRQPGLAGISVSPDTVTLNAGATKTFTATGILSDGSTAAIGVTWKASGGSIDAGGVYTSGTATGTYRVIATSTDGTYADTAKVTIPEPASAPTLSQVVLKPASVSLSISTTKQFTVFGRTSSGDSVGVAATFSATGGTITSGGLYTAGQTAGIYRVIAAVSGLADTTAVNLTEPNTGSVGVPYGPYSLITNTSSVSPFTMSTAPTTASGIVNLLGKARSLNVRLMVHMTGGSHDNYMSTIDGVYQFDFSKWKARMDSYNTATIRDAVAKAVADGVLLGNSVMDEPHVSGSGDGNTWGPPGTMTKARVDSLCAYVKRIFPALPVGVVHRWDIFEPEKNYASCDFLVSQYSARIGDVRTWRDGGLAFGQRSHVSLFFSMNLLNGGTQDRDGTWDCKDQGGFKGSYSPNCQMTASQVKSFGLVLGPSGCAFTMWRYDDAFMSRGANQSAFQDVSSAVAAAPRKPCTRT